MGLHIVPTQNLLALSRADENARENITVFSLCDLVNDATNAFLEPMSKSELSLASFVDSGVEIKADKDATFRVLSILLDNTCRYAKKGSTVEIKLCGKVFSIANECEKLPDCPPEKLFDRFYRIDKYKAKKTGTGLGLAIVKESINLCNGNISASNRMEGGLEFIFMLPIA